MSRFLLKRIPSIEVKCKLFDKTLIDCRLKQPENAELPIDVTLVGIVIDCKLEHEEKAKLPIDVTLVGIVYVENGCCDGKQISFFIFFVKRMPSLEIN